MLDSEWNSESSDVQQVLSGSRFSKVVGYPLCNFVTMRLKMRPLRGSMIKSHLLFGSLASGVLPHCLPASNRRVELRASLLLAKMLALPWSGSELSFVAKLACTNDIVGSGRIKVLVSFSSDLLTCMLPTCHPLMLWAISLKFCGKPLHFGARRSLKSML